MDQPPLTHQYLPTFDDTASGFTDQMGFSRMEADHLPDRTTAGLPYEGSTVNPSDLSTVPTWQPSSCTSVSDFQAPNPHQSSHQNEKSNSIGSLRYPMHSVAVKEMSNARRQLTPKQIKRGSLHRPVGPSPGISSSIYYQDTTLDSGVSYRTSDGIIKSRHPLKRRQSLTGPASLAFNTTSHRSSTRTNPQRPCGAAIAAIDIWMVKHPREKPNAEEIHALQFLYEPDASPESLSNWVERISRDTSGSGAEVVLDQDIIAPYRFNQGKCIKNRDVMPKIERNEDKPLPCTARCGALYENKEKWKAHELHNYPQGLWYCRHQRCARRIFFRKDHFKTHLTTNHKETQLTEEYLQESYLKIDSQYSRRCLFEDCQIKFRTWKERLNHLAEHFRGPWLESEWRQPLDESSHEPVIVSTVMDDSTTEGSNDSDFGGDNAGAAPTSEEASGAGESSSGPSNNQSKPRTDSRGNGPSDRERFFAHMGQSYDNKVCLELVPSAKWSSPQTKQNLNPVPPQKQKLNHHGTFSWYRGYMPSHVYWAIGVCNSIEGALTKVSTTMMCNTTRPRTVGLQDLEHYEVDDMFCKRHVASTYAFIVSLLRSSLPLFVRPTVIYNLSHLVYRYLSAYSNGMSITDDIFDVRAMFQQLVILRDRLGSQQDVESTGLLRHSREKRPISVERGRPAAPQLLIHEKQHDHRLYTHVSILGDLISGRSCSESSETISAGSSFEFTSATPDCDSIRDLIAVTDTKRIFGRTADSIRSVASLASDRPYRTITRKYTSETSVTMVASDSDTPAPSVQTLVPDAPVRFRKERLYRPSNLAPTTFAMSRFLSEYDSHQAFLINGFERTYKHVLTPKPPSSMLSSSHKITNDPMELEHLSAVKKRVIFSAETTAIRWKNRTRISTMKRDGIIETQKDAMEENGVARCAAKSIEFVESNGQEPRTLSLK
ncbi:hypothetical protein MMC11_003922 [Xylographa trunciseda]|nr:hypothetical protein [Xylographa trunciseda]